MATSRAKISRNCRSLSLNARGSGLSTLSVPVTRSCSMTGTVKRAAGSGGAFEIERIFARVFAQIALAGGGDEARHAVAMHIGTELPLGRFLRHAHGEHRLQHARVRIEHANFDDVVMQHVLRAVQDVRSQQLDPFIDRHLRDFVGREVGQLDAGLVNGGELLLLQHFVGNFANGDDQMLCHVVRAR